MIRTVDSRELRHYSAVAGYIPNSRLSVCTYCAVPRFGTGPLQAIVIASVADNVDVGGCTDLRTGLNDLPLPSHSLTAACDRYTLSLLCRARCVLT